MRHTATRRPGRRGSAMLEFALCTPILLSLFSAVVDYGWYFQQRAMLIDALRDGSRIGVSASSGEDPVHLAEVSARQAIMNAGYADASRITFTSEMIRVDGDYSVQLTLFVPFEPVAGLIPCPDRMEVSRTMMLERQDLEYYRG